MAKSVATFRHAEVRYQTAVSIQAPFAVPPQVIAIGLQDATGITTATTQ
jgi:hypothetical protein